MEKLKSLAVCDAEIEDLMSQLIACQLESFSASKQGVWQEIFDQVKTCHQWLTALELGIGEPGWHAQIVEGIQMAREDIQVFLA